MEWISVKDSLPDYDKDVLVFCRPKPVVYPNGIYIAHIDEHNLDSKTWMNENYEVIENVTHWMPLPEPPKQ